MKKLFIPLMLVLFTLLVSFSSFKKHKIKSKTQVSKVIKPNCNCSTATSITASLSGGTVNVSWTAVSGAMSYSVGGYFQCGGTFQYCTTTNSVSFPASCGGTLRITTNCDNSICTQATCSSNPSGPVTF